METLRELWLYHVNLGYISLWGYCWFRRVPFSASCLEGMVQQKWKDMNEIRKIVWQFHHLSDIFQMLALSISHQAVLGMCNQ